MTPGTPGDVPARVVTWNLRSLRDDANVVASTLRRLRPTVVLVQEAPRFRWDAARLGRLARRADLAVVVDGRRGGGLGLLVAPDVDVVALRVQPLSSTAGKHRRTSVVAHLATAGAEWVAASVHLGLSHVERLRHVTEIAPALAAYGALPQVVAGDTNEAPGGGVSVAMASTWRLRDATSGRASAAATYPASAPDVRIDQIWTSADVVVRRCGVPDLPELDRASDHLPVVADLALPRLPRGRAG